MIFHTTLIETNIRFYVYWVIPLLLLSPYLAHMHAQNLDPGVSCSSWHLSLTQIIGDEVKGIYLLAHDDVSSEASVCFYCPLCALLPLILSQDGQVIKCKACKKSVVAVQHSCYGHHVLVVNFWTPLYLHIIIFYLHQQNVNFVWYYVCNNHLSIIYHSCSIWTEAHGYCVLGPCRMALGWHFDMPGYSPEGLGDFMRFDSWYAMNDIDLSSFCVCMLVDPNSSALAIADLANFCSWGAAFCLSLWIHMYHISARFFLLISP